MKTTKHLDETEIKHAIVSYLRDNGVLAAAGNVKLGVCDAGNDDDSTVFSADVSECEDAPKAKRARKAKEA